MPSAPDPDVLVDRLLRLALDEDIGPGDVTVDALVEAGAAAHGLFRARAPGVMAGGNVVRRLYGLLDPRIVLAARKADGDAFAPGDILLEISGPAASVLSGERAALNLLQHLCAVAALTRAFVEAVAGTGAAILDTRKTAPGQRILDKLAVRAGGGRNHRLGLYDMVLVKDNHLAVFGGPAAAVRRAREKKPGVPVMVEVDALEQFSDALPAEPDYILLDNMPLAALREAVSRAHARAAAHPSWKRPELEASGGVTLSTARAVAETGVDRISVGALTHGAGSVDIGLDFGE